MYWNEVQFLPLMKSLPDQVLLQPSVAFLQCPPPVDQINELSGLVFVVGCSQASPTSLLLVVSWGT